MGRRQEQFSETELLSMVSRRRGMSGESYETARKNLLEYLKGSGRISHEEYERLKKAGKPRL